MPKQGPRLGSRRHTRAFLPILFIPSVKPTEVVVLPSPAGVGEIAVTSMSLPSGFSLNFPTDNHLASLWNTRNAPFIIVIVVIFKFVEGLCIQIEFSTFIVFFVLILIIVFIFIVFHN